MLYYDFWRIASNIAVNSQFLIELQTPTVKPNPHQNLHFKTRHNADFTRSFSAFHTIYLSCTLP